MKVSIIVGIGRNREIGLNNNLLWRLSEDLKNFKKITLGHHIIMGRNTYDSIGRPLPGRTNIVISRTLEQAPEGCVLAKNLDEALNIAKNNNESEAMIIGGAQIYKEALPVADKIYLSRVDFTGKADTFFPEFEHMNWEVLSKIDYPSKTNTPHWSFEELIRP